jgi:hypothetical protein
VTLERIFGFEGFATERTVVQLPTMRQMVGLNMVPYIGRNGRFEVTVCTAVHPLLILPDFGTKQFLKSWNYRPLW